MIISVSPTKISYICINDFKWNARGFDDNGEVLFPSPKGVEIGEAYSDIL